ncbi:hypothetical protein GLOTRDRAFT_135812 [Gloeophyllum trabeum ATCC 11539]|uniref:Zinc-finger domain-containing protein n=1 Tax=Gloeophyllum trabeum (strain ATCC 11539 / FP-39264 / Madison 617) TaxID=670483 RepID=S7S1J3_GLOTA|nr:uncharacterized protein GLOTRDRAFT_135812 [Gloeophyllum trabeum ATCC 11539]EPQ61325.1 hypothetical protein GLOTRDRAFT_135812 [Gloeophyllum trabeum ATCC 11539]
MSVHKYSELINWDGSLDRHLPASSTTAPLSRPPSASVHPAGIQEGEHDDVSNEISKAGVGLNRLEAVEPSLKPQDFTSGYEYDALAGYYTHDASATKTPGESRSSNLSNALSMVAAYGSSPPATVSPPDECISPGPSASDWLQDASPETPVEQMIIRSPHVRESSSASEGGFPYPTDRSLSPFVPTSLLCPAKPNVSQDLSNRNLCTLSTPGTGSQSPPRAATSDQNFSDPDFLPSSDNERSSHSTPRAHSAEARAQPNDWSRGRSSRLENVVVYVSVPPLPSDCRKEDYLSFGDCADQGPGQSTGLLGVMQAALRNNGAPATPASEPLVRQRRYSVTSVVSIKSESDTGSFVPVPSPKRRRKMILLYPSQAEVPYDEQQEYFAPGVLRASLRHAVDRFYRRANNSGGSWTAVPHSGHFPALGKFERQIPPEFIEGSSASEYLPSDSDSPATPHAEPSAFRPFDVDSLQNTSVSPRSLSLHTSPTRHKRDQASPSTSKGKSPVRNSDPYVHLDNPPGSGPTLVADDVSHAAEYAMWKLGAPLNAAALAGDGVYESHNPSIFTSGNKHDIFLGSGVPSLSPESLRLEANFQDGYRKPLGLDDSVSSSLIDPGGTTSTSLDPGFDIGSGLLGESSASADSPYQDYLSGAGTIDPSLLGGLDEDPGSPQRQESGIAEEAEYASPSGRLWSFSPGPVASDSSDSRAGTPSAKSAVRDASSTPAPPPPKRRKVILTLRAAEAQENGFRSDEDDDALDSGDTAYVSPMALGGPGRSRGRSRGRSVRGGRGGARNAASFRHSNEDMSASEGEGLSSYDKLYRVLLKAVRRDPGVEVNDPDGQLSRCHHCRRATTLLKMTCWRYNGETRCMKRYCINCITKRYPHVKFNAQARDFECPACEGICNCSHCAAKRGEEYISEHSLRADLRNPKQGRNPPPKPRKQPQGSAITAVQPETGSFFGTVYGMSGERVGKAFITTGSPSARCRSRRSFIGLPLAKWKMDADSFADSSQEDSLNRGPSLFLGDISRLDLAAYVPLVDVMERERSLSPLTELSDSEGEAAELSADRHQGALNPEDAEVGKTWLYLGEENITATLTVALAAAQS